MVVKHAQCVYVRDREQQIEIENAGDVNGYQPHVKRGIRRRALIQWRLSAWPRLSIGVWCGRRFLDPR